MGGKLGDDPGMTLMYEHNDRFVEDMTPDDAYWALTLPLSHEARFIGAITFFRSIVGEEVAVDLNNICGVFQQELGPKLAQLIENSETEKASLAY